LNKEYFLSEAIKKHSALKKSNEHIAKSRIPKPSSNKTTLLVKDERLQLKSDIEVSFEPQAS